MRAMEPVRDPEGAEITYLEQTGTLLGRQVLEIGCGNGRLTWRYASGAQSVVGIDPDVERLTTAQTARPGTLRNRVTFVLSESKWLPLPDKTFDTAVFAWSL